MAALLPVAGLLILVVAVYTGYRIYRISFRRPGSYPTRAHIKRMQRAYPRAARMVCLGDSITQGDVGASYVKLLEKRLPPEAWIILNAGINGDLSGNALARLHDVISAQPAVITLLIGTNDVHATMSRQNYETFVMLGKIKQPPSFAGYQANVAEMLGRLQKETPARIALVSIPLLSEDTDHAVNKRGDEYSNYLRELAGQFKVEYLPLREAQKTYLAASGKKGGQPYENKTRLSESAVVWSFLGLSWDKIAERVGNRLSIDNIHSNSRTAGMIADLIEGFVRKGPAE